MKISNKRLIHILVAIPFILVIMFLLMFLYGNPISRYKVKIKCENYLQENYPELNNIELEHSYSYSSNTIGTISLENMEHIFNFYCNDKPLLYFNIKYNYHGDLIYDGYKNSYLKGETVYNYYSDKYSSYFSEIYKSKHKDDTNTFGLTTKSMFEGNNSSASFISIYEDSVYNGPKLDMNKEYDMLELADEYGILFFKFANEEENSVEDLYQKRCIVKENLSEFDIPFKYITITYDFIESGKLEGVYEMTKEQFLADDMKDSFFAMYES